MASPRTRRVLKDLKIKDDNNVRSLKLPFQTSVISLMLRLLNSYVQFKDNFMALNQYVLQLSLTLRLRAPGVLIWTIHFYIYCSNSVTINPNNWMEADELLSYFVWVKSPLTF